MDFNLKLSTNLELRGVVENNWDEDKLIAVLCIFNFFGEEGLAYVGIGNLESERARYAMTEISTELAESFNDLLEDEDNWKKIVESIKKYIKEDWEPNNLPED